MLTISTLTAQEPTCFSQSLPPVRSSAPGGVELPAPAHPPSAPHDIQDIYCNIFGEATTDEVHTFCKRELIQAIWKLLLDEDFMHAYEHGMVVRCADGITRRVFPRFFSYSADYPEK
jgi:hypothetical protein